MEPIVETVVAVVEKLRSAKTCSGKPSWVRIEHGDDQRVLGAITRRSPLALEYAPSNDMESEAVIVRIGDQAGFEAATRNVAECVYRADERGIVRGIPALLAPDSGWRPTPEAALDEWIDRECTSKIKRFEAEIADCLDAIRRNIRNLRFARARLKEINELAENARKENGKC